MNKDQLMSLIRTILKVVGSALATHGATTAANLVNAEDTAGLVMTIIGFVWSHWTHAGNLISLAKQSGPVLLVGLMLLSGGTARAELRADYLRQSTISPATGTNSLNGTNGTPTFLTTIWDAVQPLLTATNYAFEPYATYAPALKKAGGGIFVAYNVNNYVGAGVAVDYLGQFSLVSASLQLRYAIHPLANYGAPNFAIVPFVMTGVGKGMGGATGAGIITWDAGGYFQFGEWWGGSFNLGGAYGQWENAGPYSGERWHIFGGWSKGF